MYQLFFMFILFIQCCRIIEPQIFLNDCYIADLEKEMDSILSTKQFCWEFCLNSLEMTNLVKCI